MHTSCSLLSKKISHNKFFLSYELNLKLITELPKDDELFVILELTSVETENIPATRISKKHQVPNLSTIPFLPFCISNKLSLSLIPTGTYDLYISLVDNNEKNLCPPTKVESTLKLDNNDNAGSLPKSLFTVEHYQVSLDAITIDLNLNNPQLIKHKNINYGYYLYSHLEPITPIYEAPLELYSEINNGENRLSIILENGSLNLPHGIYEVRIFLLYNDTRITYCISYQDQKKLIIPWEGTLKQYDKKYINEHIEIIEKKTLHNSLIYIKGKVHNIGSQAWITSQKVKYHYTLGARLFLNNDLIAETRFIPKLEIIPAGDSFYFYIYFIVQDLSETSYTIELNMLKEGVFWFKLLGTEPLVDEIKVEEYSKPLSFSNTIKKYRVLIISPCLPLFDRESGGKRLFAIMKILKSIGVSVDFYFQSSGIPFTANLNQYFEALQFYDINIITSLYFENQVKEASYSHVILPWWSSAEIYINKIREDFKDAQIIIDSVDVHWERLRRGIEFGKEQISQNLWEDQKKREITVYAASDIVLAVSENDKKEILNYIPFARVKIISNIHDELNNIVRNPEDIPSVMFIGQFRHTPNISGALWAHEIVEKYISDTGRKLRLYIVGDNPPSEIQLLDNANTTIVTGHIADISEYQKKVHTLLAPLHYGFGVKGKITEAASLGIPVITNSIGNEGIDFIHEKDALIANSTDEFVQCLKDFFSGYYDLKSLTVNAKRKIDAICSPRVAEKNIRSIFEAKPIIISIVTHNRKDLLKKCIDSIILNTKYPLYRIVITSNGCTDGTLDMLKDYERNHPERFYLVHNARNEFFVRPNNKVIEIYSDADILLMNNDTEVLSENFLEELYFAAYSSPIVGAAGGMMIDVDGLVGEAGANLDNQGLGGAHGKGCPTNSPEVYRPRYVGYVSGSLLYMKREAIDLIGSLDEDFHPMYYEDSAWQYKLHTQGLKTIYTPRVKILHHEGGTAGTNLEQGMKRYQEINRPKFISKFSSYNLNDYNEC